MDDIEWVKVYETSQQHLALMVQSILQENNIEVVILNQQDSSYGTFGEIMVCVPLEQSIEASLLIDQELK